MSGISNEPAANGWDLPPGGLTEGLEKWGNLMQLQLDYLPQHNGRMDVPAWYRDS